MYVCGAMYFVFNFFVSVQFVLLILVTTLFLSAFRDSMTNTLHDLRRELAHLGSENNELHAEVVHAKADRAAAGREYGDRIDFMERKTHEMKHENAQLRHRLEVVTAEGDEVKMKFHQAMQNSGALLPAVRQHFSTNDRTPSAKTLAQLPGPAHSGTEVDTFLQRAEQQIVQQQRQIKSLESQVASLKKNSPAGNSGKSAVVPGALQPPKSASEVATTVHLQSQIQYLDKEVAHMGNMLKEEQKKSADLARNALVWEEALNRQKEEHDREVSSYVGKLKTREVDEKRLQDALQGLEDRLLGVTRERDTIETTLEKVRREAQESVNHLVAQLNRQKAHSAEVSAALHRTRENMKPLAPRCDNETNTPQPRKSTNIAIQCILRTVTADAEVWFDSVKHKQTSEHAVNTAPKPIMYDADIQAAPVNLEGVSSTKVPMLQDKSSRAAAHAASMDVIMQLSRERDGLHVQLDDVTLSLGETNARLQELENAFDKLQVQHGATQQELTHQTALAKEFESSFRREEARNQLLLRDNAEMHQHKRNLARDVTDANMDVHKMVAEREAIHQQLQDAVKSSQELEQALQDALQRETMLQGALGAKQHDFDELLQVYQQVTEANRAETLKVSNLERMVQNMTTHSAQSEEHLRQELVANEALSKKEELLAADLQACSYENTALHRKLDEHVHAQNQWERAYAELQQTLSQAQLVNREMERSYNDLLRQHTLTQNEVKLLRSMNEDVGCEAGVSRTALEAEQARCRQLENQINELMLRELRNVSTVMQASTTPSSVRRPTSSLPATPDVSMSLEQIRSEKVELERRVSAQQALVQLLDEENRRLRGVAARTPPST